MQFSAPISNFFHAQKREITVRKATPKATPKVKFHQFQNTKKEKPLIFQGF